MDEIEKTLSAAKGVPRIKDLALETEELGEHLKKTVTAIGQKAVSPEFKTAFAHSLPLLDTIGDAIMAWMLLWRASVADGKLAANPKKKDMPFYQGQIQTAEFFIRTRVPVTRGRLDAILRASPVAIEITNDAFGGL